MKYPIAELFQSVQGEGFWTGTPMLFVRLAGCNVGKYEGSCSDHLVNVTSSQDEGLFLDKKHSICTTFDGQKFLCDTDYHTAMNMEVDEIVSHLRDLLHVCITGGEPLLHDLKPLAYAFRKVRNVMIHLETSGTRFPQDIGAWITLCPKAEFLPVYFQKANEFKVLVGPNWNLETFLAFDETLNHFKRVHRYFQPINGVHEVWQENLKHCLSLVQQYPHWKLSAQLHKFIQVR